MTFERRPKKEMRPEAALIRLEELCARSEQCEYEIRRKLASWQIAPDDADTIVRSLMRRRFVDDSRYAAAFVRDKYRFTGWGRRRIEQALKQKRISSDTICEALEEIDEEEYRRIITSLVRRKAAALGGVADYETRVKLLRFGVARGFEVPLVSEIIRELTK